MNLKELICKIIGHKFVEVLPKDFKAEIRFKEAKYVPEEKRFLESSKLISYEKCLRCGGEKKVRIDKYWSFPKKSS
jgi:hypothetical protein